MLESKKIYEYSGPVIVDGQRATWRWTARTWAVSPQKARCNLVHRFKEQNDISYKSNVNLDGDVVLYEFEPRPTNKVLIVNENAQLTLDI